ncbi:MAG TPA: trypsin-like peptidase domain-containing protein [Candidatus Acidoferrum sp.]|jgi:S1-C subfamily serine protease
MFSSLRRFLCAALFLCACGAAARGDKLKIDSVPPGATVEIDGVNLGTTPLEKDYPGGYFHRTVTVLGKRLERPMVLRVTLEGYTAREVQLTQGPMNWIGHNGHNHGQYWTIKSDHIQVKLEKLSEVFTGNVSAKVSSGEAVELGREMPLEDLVAYAKPAVVYLKGLEKSGTGFFVSDTGVIATNAHVARGEESLLTVFVGGQQLSAKVVYVDPDFDIALAKVDGSGFPHLTLVDAANVRDGENVVAIGNPGDAMPFSATKGIVSAVGRFPTAGPGTWIQTDAPINPGNSGGPLLNSQGEVIGINTQKLVKKNVNGIGFALSASDLLNVLHRFYPDIGSVTEKMSAPAKTSASASGDGGSQSGFGTIVVSQPEAAEIWIDHKFVGNAPATLTLAAGDHVVVVRVRGRADWIRNLNVLKNSNVNLAPPLD